MAHLTRGQFLKSGGALAAGAALGHELEVEASPSHGSPQALTCPPSAERWRIPAGHLNTLWGELLPRVAARVWRGGGGEPATIPPSDYTWPIATVGNPPPDVRGWFIRQILWFLGHDLAAIAGWPAGGAQALPPPAMQPHGGASFRDRLERLGDYLGGPGPHIPMRFVAEGAFDFLLSDAGLDLFAPPRPTDAREVFLFYTYRATGRNPIGLPSVEGGVSPAFQIASPTGPSQIVLDSQSIYYAQLARASCAQGAWVTVGGQFPRRLDGQVVVSFDCIECALRETRCWQISGAVYRGILHEYPRIVATTWYEGAPDPSRYAARFGNPLDDGLREIFMERLETSLPGHEKMLLEVPGAASLPQIQALLAANQALVHPPAPPEVTVTNQGLIFPPPPGVPQLTTLAAGNPNGGLLEQIIDGRAGNPVFTDSARSDD